MKVPWLPGSKHTIANKRPDATTMKRWRLETLKGLCSTREFQRRQRAQTDEVSEALYSALSFLLPWDRRIEGSAREKLHAQIIVPAVQLAMSVRLSTATYRVSFGRVPTSIVCEEDTQRCVVTDITTKELVSPGRVAKVGSYGRIGVVKLVHRPGLECLDGDKGEGMLCKPEILVQLDVPLRGRR